MQDINTSLIGLSLSTSTLPHSVNRTTTGLVVIKKRTDELIERAEKLKIVSEKLANAIQGRDIAVENRNAADAKESEIGNIYDSIASKYNVIISHCKNIIEAYNTENQEMVDSILNKVAVLEDRIEKQNKRVQILISEQINWEREVGNRKELILEREIGATFEISIRKRSFSSPLVRVEKVLDAEGKVVSEKKMAAEYLLVKLKSEASLIELERELKEKFPDNSVTVEEVFPRDLLYRLNFKAFSTESKIQLFSAFKQNALENEFVADCYPSAVTSIDPCWEHQQNENEILVGIDSAKPRSRLDLSSLWNQFLHSLGWSQSN